jgi:hypothetical protein
VNGAAPPREAGGSRPAEARELSPEIARLLAPRLWPAAIALEALLPPLRTHRLAVLRKETHAS